MVWSAHFVIPCFKAHALYCLLCKINLFCLCLSTVSFFSFRRQELDGLKYLRTLAKINLGCFISLTYLSQWLKKKNQPNKSKRNKQKNLALCSYHLWALSFEKNLHYSKDGVKCAKGFLKSHPQSAGPSLVSLLYSSLLHNRICF